MTGLLLVDKPAGMTSHDVVDRVRAAAAMRRIGHTGTLDPAATGLLILCLGNATRLSEHLTGLDKTYEGVMRLGVVTDSHDMDGAVLQERDVPELTEEEIRAAFEKFTGEIEQIPPMVSAVKIGGERLYKKARKGETVERKPRAITVKKFELLSFESPRVQFRIECSRGTYVRTICHDLGELIGCGGALESLRRTAVGAHRIEDAHALDELQTPDDVRAALLPIEEALDLPQVFVRNASKRIVAAGGALLRKDLKADCPIQDGWIQLKADTGELLALALVETSPVEMRILPRRVFYKP